jgi:hypothetical protein
MLPVNPLAVAQFTDPGSLAPLAKAARQARRAEVVTVSNDPDDTHAPRDVNFA